MIGWSQASDVVEGLHLKSKHLVVSFTIKKHSTPASKVLGPELPFIHVRAEGQTAEADAIDAGGSFTSPQDSTGKFGLLLADLGVVKEVKLVSVLASTGSVAATAAVTASGNVSVDCDSDQDLSADTSTVLTFTLVLDYRLKK